MYVHAERKWYQWTGKVWNRDDNEAIYEAVRSELRRLPALPEDFRDKDTQRQMAHLVQRCQSNAGQTAVIDLMRSYGGVSRAEVQWAARPVFLPLNNCTLNLDGGRQEHCREDYFNALMPFAYDDAAVCPRWTQFLGEILPDPEVQGYVQRIMGYSLSGYTSEQKLFLLYGTGANGKSIFCEVWKSLLGGDGIFATNVAPNTLLEFRNKGGDACPDIVGLKGKRIALSTEVPDGKLSEGLVKSLTGSDSIIARRLYQDYQTFSPTHKLILMSNHRPSIQGQDHGIWRRIVLIDFPVQIPPEKRRPDHVLLAELRAELPGILNWARAGYSKWKKGGLMPPKGVLKSTEEYQLENDTLRQFFDECLIKSDNGRIKTATLFMLFNGWQKRNGFNFTVNSTRFVKMMKEKGVEKAHTRDGNFWLGYVVRADALTGDEKIIVDEGYSDPGKGLNDLSAEQFDRMMDGF
jgi:putative DNA primase/helicase